MSEPLEGLISDKTHSSAKSYFIGLERGRVWAQDQADYFELRQWSEQDAIQFDDLVLPDKETDHFSMLVLDTPLEWNEYLKGWLDGVREILQRY